MTAASMPAVFVGHGSPMNAVTDNEFRRSWQELGRTLPRPKSVLCISAHWETRGVYVTSAQHPETIHDFYGFPQALFDFQYPAPGDPILAERVARLVGSVRVHFDPVRGLDHGAWCVLSAMYPAADVPVVQLSLDSAEAGEFHYVLGRELAPLREEGVLIVASGNIVHNLALWHARATEPYDWAQRFDSAVRERVVSAQHRDLIHWHNLAPDAHLAVPTPEHYLPLLYVLALQRDDDKTSLFNRVVHSSLSMTSVLVETAA